MVKNIYPELPEIPYKRTSVSMALVKAFALSLKGKYDTIYIAVAYAAFRNESANGTKGVNNNYGGIQADNARWTDLPGKPIATCVKIDSGNVARRFLCFGEDGYKISFELKCIKFRDRNVTTPAGYFKKWVGRTVWSTQEETNIQSMINQALKLLA